MSQKCISLQADCKYRRYCQSFLSYILVLGAFSAAHSRLKSLPKAAEGALIQLQSRLGEGCREARRRAESEGGRRLGEERYGAPWGDQGGRAAGLDHQLLVPGLPGQLPQEEVRLGTGSRRPRLPRLPLGSSPDEARDGGALEPISSGSFVSASMAKHACCSRSVPEFLRGRAARFRHVQSERRMASGSCQSRWLPVRKRRRKEVARLLCHLKASSAASVTCPSPSLISGRRAVPSERREVALSSSQPQHDSGLLLVLARSQASTAFVFL